MVRWKGHFPQLLLPWNVDELLKSASITETIVVVADIRKSQDLMTYGKNADSYSRHIVQFIETSRQLIDESMGIFDKFTGDGFIVYFNDAICGSRKCDFVQCFLKFIHNETDFAAVFFPEWTKTIRKLPPSPVGLAVGADVGRIDFRDLNNHLIAVGDAIVWASRMASGAQAGQILVNNVLFNMLEGRSQNMGIIFNEFTGHTKSGESFLAKELTFSKQNPGLLWAARLGLSERVKKFVESGKTDVNVKSESGTSLILAARSGHTDTVLMLFKMGANLNETDSYGWTALMHAANRGHASIVKELIQARADVTLSDGRHDTALDIAKWRGHGEIIRMLEASSASQLGPKS